MTGQWLTTKHMLVSKSGGFSKFVVLWQWSCLVYWIWGGLLMVAFSVEKYNTRLQLIHY